MKTWSIEFPRELPFRFAWMHDPNSALCTSLVELDALFATLQHRAFREDL